MEAAPSCGEVTLESLISQECNIALSTVVARRSAVVDAGLFDEDLWRGQDFDLWLRLALRGVTMRYQETVLAERRVRADGLSGDSVAEIQRAARARSLRPRVRARSRGAHDAARAHDGWKLRLALVALQVAPRLARAAYLRMRPSLWRPVPVR